MFQLYLHYISYKINSFYFLKLQSHQKSVLIWIHVRNFISRYYSRLIACICDKF